MQLSPSTITEACKTFLCLFCFSVKGKPRKMGISSMLSILEILDIAMLSVLEGSGQFISCDSFIEKV